MRATTSRAVLSLRMSSLSSPAAAVACSGRPVWRVFSTSSNNNNRNSIRPPRSQSQQQQRGDRSSGRNSARGKAIELNSKLTTFNATEEVLQLFASSGQQYNDVNLSTSLSRLSKLQQDNSADLNRDPRFRQLLQVIVKRIGDDFGVREIANSLNSTG